MRFNTIIFAVTAVLAFGSLLYAEGGAVTTTYEFTAKETLTPVELNHGDTLRFKLCNGQVRTLVLEDSSAEVLERPPNLPGAVYGFTCRLRVDGHPLTIQRYVSTQESFYEPIIVNGLRIWFDMALDVFRKIPARNPYIGVRRQHPHKDVRLVLQDATLPICPQEMVPWYSNKKGWIPIGSCYNGEDCWMGVYLGQSCHGGLDINHKCNDPLWAPIDFDDQWCFDSLEAGANNNRWRGIRRWPSGDVWALQTHHMVSVLVPPHTPVKAGTHYAKAAGVRIGNFSHTHYEFKIAKMVDGKTPDFDASGEKLKTKIYEEKPDMRAQQPEVFHLDPWIIVWQIFECQKDREGAIKARMAPLAPVKTGEPVAFSSGGSRAGKGGGILEQVWSFGDGSGARGVQVAHVFARPGIYPVTLTVDDGHGRASFTQHITVDGQVITKPVLGFSAPDEHTFRNRPLQAMDTYAQPVPFLPFTLDMLARDSRPVPMSRDVHLVNVGGGELPRAVSTSIEYTGRAGWLTAKVVDIKDEPAIRVSVDARGLEAGMHVARVKVDCPGALNAPQEFRVQLKVRREAPATVVTVDDNGPGFSCTPWFWIGHRFAKRTTDYRTNGSRAVAGEVARFTPDLAAGTYDVAFGAATPFEPGASYDVRVRHRDGEQIVRVEPHHSLTIGCFAFDEGEDGFVEILAGGSKGLIVLDTVVFTAAAKAPEFFVDQETLRR